MFTASRDISLPIASNGLIQPAPRANEVNQMRENTGQEIRSVLQHLTDIFYNALLFAEVLALDSLPAYFF
jgi:hypothetical protein